MTDMERQARPVFIHAMWRTGSTYIWNKFREQSGYRAYYEPLHEHLWLLRRKDFENEEIQTTNRQLRHPELKKHYFDEFPSDAEGRVPLFREEFTFDTYCLEPEEDSPDLAAYIQSLLDFAAAQNEIPVLQFNRSVFRSAWLSSRFSPISLLLHRDPFDTWKSFGLSDYFSVGVCRIIGRHRNRPNLRAIAERWKVPYVTGTFEEQDAAYRAYFQQHGDALYPMLYAVMVESVLYNLPHTDLILDMNALSASGEVRSGVQSRLREFGISVSFEDCAIPHYSSSEDDRIARREQERIVLRYFRSVYHARRGELQPVLLRHAPLLSPGLRADLESILCE